MIALAPSGSADAKNARFTTACVEGREPLDWSEDDYSVAESPERAQTPGPREGVGGDGPGVLGLTGRGVRESHPLGSSTWKHALSLRLRHFCEHHPRSSSP